MRKWIIGALHHGGQSLVGIKMAAAKRIDVGHYQGPGVPYHYSALIVSHGPDRKPSTLLGIHNKRLRHIACYIRKKHADQLYLRPVDVPPGKIGVLHASFRFVHLPVETGE